MYNNIIYLVYHLKYSSYSPTLSLIFLKFYSIRYICLTSTTNFVAFVLDILKAFYNTSLNSLSEPLNFYPNAYATYKASTFFIKFCILTSSS